MNTQYSEKLKVFYLNINNSIQYLAELFDISTPSILEQPNWLVIANYSLCLDALEIDEQSKAVTYLQTALAAFDTREKRPHIHFVDDVSINSEAIKCLELIYSEPENNPKVDGDFTFWPFNDDGKLARDKEVNSIHRALEILEHHSHSYYEAIKSLVTDIFVTGEKIDGYIRSGSTVRAFGAIINTPKLPNNVLQYIEDFVHESTHHKLYLEQLDDELILSTAEKKFPACFREDKAPRGLPVTFQAYFVIGSIILCFTELKESADDIEELANLDEKTNQFIKWFCECAEILSMNAEMTVKGWSLFHEMRKNVDHRLNEVK